jgi:thiol:disulfide interchange protein
VIIDSNINIKSPELYIKSKSNVKFGSPKTAIDGNRVSIRFDILNKNHNLTSQEIELTFTPNKIKAYRLYKQPQSSSIFDINSQQLNLGLILLAFLGGIILNFMPCVFPVLSLKFLSLTKFGAKNTQNVKHNFILSAIGILTGFFLI